MSRRSGRGREQPSTGERASTSGSRSFERQRRAQRAREERRRATERRRLLASAGTGLDVRGLLARVPLAAWLCALVALLNGAAWSILTPPFQGRDEPAHFAYVQQLAETGTLPHASEQEYLSPREAKALEGLHQNAIKLSPEVPAISSRAEQQALSADLGEAGSAVGSGGAGVATPEPPLYYMIETVPYALGGGDTLVQLQLMRLLSALLGAITTVLVFLFVREVAPRPRWAATIAAACVALQPLFGFMSGTLNPDTLLYAIAAAIFVCLARAFRRGLSTRLAIVLGVLIAAGFMTKLNFIGLALGVFAGIALLGVRELRAHGRAAIRPIALAAGIGAAPVLLYVLANALSSKPALGGAGGTLASLTGGAAWHEASYIWGLYLPGLPGMTSYFPGLTTLRDVWFDRSIGLYGWIDTELPTWAYNLALIPAAAIALLCARAAVTARAGLRERLPELATYAAMSIGVLLIVGGASYVLHNTDGIQGFGDPRYLLPLLPLLGAALALAMRGAGRWAAMAAALILVAFLAHDLFSQLQVIARYYG